MITCNVSFFFFFSVLAFKLRALCLLASVLLLDPHSQHFFAFSYFSDRVSIFCLGPVSDHNPPTYFFCVAVIIDVYTMPGLFCWMEVLLTFCLGWLQTRILLISWVAGITCVHHHTQLFIIIKNVIYCYKY
jgi:hypothetical protein